MQCLPEGLRGRKYYKPTKRDKTVVNSDDQPDDK
jgi:hypothetical protein